jgi:hypothetical protein
MIAVVAHTSKHRGTDGNAEEQRRSENDCGREIVTTHVMSLSDFGLIKPATC